MAPADIGPKNAEYKTKTDTKSNRRAWKPQLVEPLPNPIFSGFSRK